MRCGVLQCVGAVGRHDVEELDLESVDLMLQCFAVCCSVLPCDVAVGRHDVEGVGLRGLF